MLIFCIVCLLSSPLIYHRFRVLLHSVASRIFANCVGVFCASLGAPDLCILCSCCCFRCRWWQLLFVAACVATLGSGIPMPLARFCIVCCVLIEGTKGTTPSRHIVFCWPAQVMARWHWRMLIFPIRGRWQSPPPLEVLLPLSPSLRASCCGRLGSGGHKSPPPLCVASCSNAGMAR